MGALMLVLLLAALDQTIVSTALPKIASEFNGLSQLSWVVTAYLLTSAVTTPLYGKISDLFGRKKVLSVAIIIFLIGSALAGAAQNMLELILFRGVQGLGAGGLISLVLAGVLGVLRPHAREVLVEVKLFIFLKRGVKIIHRVAVFLKPRMKRVNRITVREGVPNSLKPLHVDLVHFF